MTVVNAMPTALDEEDRFERALRPGRRLKTFNDAMFVVMGLGMVAAMIAMPIGLVQDDWQTASAVLATDLMALASGLIALLVASAVHRMRIGIRNRRFWFTAQEAFHLILNLAGIALSLFTVYVSWE